QAAIAQRVMFYRRFEGLLSALGLARLPGQTQREFAAAAEPHLDEWKEVDGVSGDLAAVVVDSFYRVRFGDQQLSGAESTVIDEGLSKLERHVAAKKSNGQP
ncbi:MAG: DUF4129 domain-containing protein, partial [Planctomycetes bacterium]|nr:DUF4129 domain-containing protein [Planctomycetota bacterium]